jgi:hypothetical protein
VRGFAENGVATVAGGDKYKVDPLAAPCVKGLGALQVSAGLPCLFPPASPASLLMGLFCGRCFQAALASSETKQASPAGRNKPGQRLQLQLVRRKAAGEPYRSHPKGPESGIDGERTLPFLAGGGHKRAFVLTEKMASCGQDDKRPPDKCKALDHQTRQHFPHGSATPIW